MPPRRADRGPLLAEVDPHVAAFDPLVAEVDPHVAAFDPLVAEVDPHVAALDPLVAEVDPHVAALDPLGGELEPLAAAPVVTSRVGRRGNRTRLPAAGETTQCLERPAYFGRGAPTSRGRGPTFGCDACDMSR